MERVDVVALFLHFLMLIFMSVGGVQAVMPDMYRYVVEANHWITAKQFADSYVLAQAAPGPNVMFVTLVGWQVGGWTGAAATTIALLMPACTLTMLAVKLHARNPEARFGRALRRGLAPITIGLVLASGWILVRAADHDWQGYLLTAVAVFVALRTKWNPLWLIALGAVAGIAGFV